VGLSGRDTLPENGGMLFVFPEDRQLSFWMKDTRIPLSIAFIRADGTIANIEKMSPYSLDTHLSYGPVRYALEMNQGWFERRGIRAGAQVALPPEILAPAR